MKKSESKEQKLGPQCYRNYMTLAVRLYLEKKYTQAIHFFGEALDLSPGNKHCLVARSKCYLKEGRPDKALKDTELALQSDNAFPDAVLQKAESYFQQSNFEAALVHFHRGSQFQVKQEMFIKGVYKCEEAILNAVRWLDKVKKKFGEETTDEERTDTKKSEDKNMTSVFVFENDSTLPSEDKMWILLAELYEDKKFLQKVLRKIDCRREHGWLSKLVVINQIVYFNNQSKFLLAKMPVIERLKQGARSKLGDDLQEINRIYKAKKFRECIDKCVNILNTYSMKELGSKQRHLAEVYSLIGACYLEKKMVEEARIIYLNLLAIGDLLDDSEIILNAVSGLVVTYSDDKEYKMFVDVGETDNVGISELQEMWFNYRLGLSYLGVNNEIAKKYINMCRDCAETGMNNYYLTHSLMLLACANIRTKDFKEALKSTQTCYDYMKEEKSTESLVAVENVLKLLTIAMEEAAREEEERLLKAEREKEEAERRKKEEHEAKLLKLQKLAESEATLTPVQALTETTARSDIPENTEAASLITDTEETSFLTNGEPSVIAEEPKLIVETPLVTDEGKPPGAANVQIVPPLMTEGEREPAIFTEGGEPPTVAESEKEPSFFTEAGQSPIMTEGEKEPSFLSEGREPSIMTEGEKEPSFLSEGREPSIMADSEKEPSFLTEDREPSIIADGEKEPSFLTEGREPSIMAEGDQEPSFLNEGEEPSGITEGGELSGVAVGEGAQSNITDFGEKEPSVVSENALAEDQQ